MFSNIFDNYDINVKNSLLLNTSTGKYKSQISWNWHDWNYIGENSKNKKQSMKKIFALHFTRSICVNKNPNPNLLSTSEKGKVKIHSVNIIPISWRGYVSKEIIKLKTEFDPSDNLKLSFENKIYIINIITINKYTYILFLIFKLI